MNVWRSSILSLSLAALPVLAEDMKTKVVEEAMERAVDQAADKAVQQATDKVSEAVGSAVGQATGSPGTAPAPAMTPEQQAMMEAWEKASTPGAQHSQLAEHFVGTWTANQKMWMDPAAEPMTQTGQATTMQIMDGRHLRMDYEGAFMGQPFKGVSYMGYDNVTGKYYGTWIDSMGTGFFLAHGSYDPAARTYTFNGELADPMKGGAKMPIREVMRIVDADKHVFEWYETHDGAEVKTMEIEYVRVK